MTQETTVATKSVFLDLGDLLSESMEQKTAREAEKELRKRVSRGNLPQAELAESQAILRRWDNQREWKRSKNLLVFNRQRCTGCGAYHQTLDGFFEQYTNTRLSNTVKMTAVQTFELPDLQKDVEYRDSEVAICHLCADIGGWPLQED
jgi:hypothetical protein